MNPHKKSGKSARFQTREEAHDEAIAAEQPAIEIIREGDYFIAAGNRTLHKPEAVTADDIRIVVDGDDGARIYEGPWNKPSERAAMERAWNADNS